MTGWSPHLTLAGCCLAPGPTGTGFAAQADAAGSRLFRRGVMDPDRVAQAGHEGLRRGKTWSFWPAQPRRVPAPPGWAG